MAGELPPLRTNTSSPIVTETSVQQAPQKESGAAPIEPHPEAQLFPDGNERRGAEISTEKVGRHALPKRGIALFGTTIPAVARPIELPVLLERGVAKLLGDVFRNRGPFSNEGRIEDYRNDAAVQKALADPLAAPRGILGPLTIFRPGLGNTAPGPAQIARLAQYTDKLVIAYANPGSGDEAKLRPITEVDGVQLPPELQGKIWAIGSPTNLMISFEQASDLFLQQLESMRVQGLDLRDARATVVAHSQGGLDALLTRRRLVEAGFENTFGRLVTLATPFRGSPVSDESMAGVFAELGDRLFDKQATRAINALDPDHVRRVITDRDRELVDVSLIGQTESGREGRSDLRTFFEISDFAIEATKSIASIFKGRDVRENDGLVTVSSQLFGRLLHRLEKSYDHAGIAEDPAVADQVARLLA
jgi:hypothetical protein